MPAAPRLSELVEALEREVAPAQPVQDKVHRTEQVLSRFLGSALDLPGLLPRDHYARYLLHRDPDDRFSLVAMVWGPGQETAIHDHDGVWCVEGVHQGEIAVTQYHMRPVSAVLRTMEPQRTVIAGPKALGNLFPPFEHHRISNPNAEVAITLHVYGRELTHCRRFVPTGDGHYRDEIIPLQYDGKVGDQPPVRPINEAASGTRSGSRPAAGDTRASRIPPGPVGG